MFTVIVFERHIIPLWYSCDLLKKQTIFKLATRKNLTTQKKLSNHYQWKKDMINDI